MTSVITDTLVCGNCTECHMVRVDGKVTYYCAYNKVRVRQHTVFCLDFTWNGITESPKQLLRFSKGERQKAAQFL